MYYCSLHRDLFDAWTQYHAIYLEVHELVPRAARLARRCHSLRGRGVAAADMPQERLQACNHCMDP